MKLLRILSITTLMGVTLTCQALELSVTTGYEDNPFSMHKAESGSSFAGLQTSHEGRTEGRTHFRYSFGLDLQQHEDSKADSLNARTRIRWVKPISLFDRSASLLITGDAGAKRQDYVDQLTGQIALTRDGDQIDERYNYNYGKLSAEGILRFDRYKSVAIYAYAEKRNYTNDYESLDLESLDYQESGIQPSFRWKSRHGSYLRAMAFIRHRDYLGLLDDDTTGSNVLGSTVDYQLKGVSLLLKHPLSTQLMATIYAVAYRARDNYVGTRDLDAWQLKSTVEYTFNNDARLALNLAASDRGYINDRAGRRNPEERIPGKEQRTYTASLNYERPLRAISEQLHLSLSYEYQRADNSDEQRSFSSNRVLLGLRYQW